MIERLIGILLLFIVGATIAIVPSYALQAAGQPEPTPPASAPGPVPPEKAAAAARALVGTVGTDLQLIDVRRMTYGESVVFLNREPDNFLGSPGDPSPDLPVWVVRFRGRFSQDISEYPLIPGVGFAVIDATTGSHLYYGFQGGSPSF